MKDHLGGAIWRLAVFMTVCLLGMFALFAVFGQLRFEKAETYRAHFANVTGLESNNFVRIAGVEVVHLWSVTPGAYAPSTSPNVAPARAVTAAEPATAVINAAPRSRRASFSSWCAT